MVNIMAKPDLLRTQHTDTHTQPLSRKAVWEESPCHGGGQRHWVCVWGRGVCTLRSVRIHDPMHWSLPGSSVHGIFQARILEWVAISYSRGSS